MKHKFWRRSNEEPEFTPEPPAPELSENEGLLRDVAKGYEELRRSGTLRKLDPIDLSRIDGRLARDIQLEIESIRHGH